MSEAVAGAATANLDLAAIANAAAARRRRILWRERLLRFSSILLFFVIWAAFTHLNQSVWRLFNPLLIPTPKDVLAAGVDMVRSGTLLHDIAASLYRVLWGFVVAAVAGVGVGIAVSRSRTISALVEPIIEMFRPIPSLAFLPIFILWFGIGEISKIVFIAYATFFPVFTATVLGLRQIDPVLVRAAASLGASNTDIFRYVELPAASPSIITGLRIGFGMSFFVIVAAEFIAADSGLGFLINNSRTFFDVPRMLVGAAVIGTIGFAFNTALRRIESWLLVWQPQSNA
jgi:ABC-type nitrate/sulfonate/bicarbonate transport system permease component